MTDAAAKKAYVFQGDAKPTTSPGVKSYDSISAPSFGELAIGGLDRVGVYGVGDVPEFNFGGIFRSYPARKLYDGPFMPVGAGCKDNQC